MKTLIELDGTPDQVKRFIRAGAYATLDPRGPEPVHHRADAAFRQAESTGQARLLLGQVTPDRTLAAAGCL